MTVSTLPFMAIVGNMTGVMQIEHAKILVTGGAGYIGSVLVPMLLSAGHKVTVIDSFLYGPSLLDCVHYSGLTIVRGEAWNETLIAKHIKGKDYIIPLAALVGASACDRDSTRAIAVNCGAITSLLKLRKKNQRILFPNTNSGYGIGRKGIACDERTSMKPISLYGKTKAEAEKAILKAGNAVVFRLATVFGVSPRMRLDLLVNDFVFRAVNDRFIVLFEAHFMRNYIHVQDVARVFMHAMDHFDAMKNEVYNVGLSDANLSKAQLCAEIKKQIPDFYYVEAMIGEDKDKRNYVVSNAKIERAGFKPSVSLRDGIAELIKGYVIIRRNSFSNT